MDKIGNSSGIGHVITNQIPQNDAPPSSVPKKSANELGTTTTSTKSEQQEATSRKSESSFQATVRKEGLLKETPVQGARFVERTLRSESEIRELVLKKAFPAVKKGMESQDFSVNDRNCHIGAGLMKAALERQGLRDVAIKEGPLHAYVEVKTKEGKTLIIDPTASQFFKDGTAIDQKLQSEGFVGTKEELKKMIHGDLEHWKFADTWPVNQDALDASRGKSVAGLSQEDAEQVISGHLSDAYRTYFGGETKTMGVTAEKIAERCENNDLDRQFKVSSGEDIAPKLKKALEIIDQSLKE
jgi:hypothetical protein